VAAIPRATRNQDNLEQLLFGARCYQAMGRKLVMLDHRRDAGWPRQQLRAEMAGLLATYKLLQRDFTRLWLTEDRDSKTFRGMVGWFDQTIKPVEQAVADLDRLSN
jgi:hypothetical protein